MKPNFLILCLFAIFSFSCSGDDEGNSTQDPPTPQGEFDINNPIGWGLFLKDANEDGTWSSFLLLEFKPGRILKVYGVQNEAEDYPYDFIDEQTIEIANGRIVFEDDSIIYQTLSDEMTLIKFPETNLLAGKSFSGTYYRKDNSVLHENFFYSFSSSGTNTVDAGLEIGNPLRTENYESICNIAAKTQVAGTDDKEMMVWVNGKLEVNYYTPQPIERHHGSFTEQ